MRQAVKALIVLSMAAAVVGFYLPWALIDVHEPGGLRQLRTAAPLGHTLGGLTHDVGRITATIRRGTDTVTGELNLADIPRQVSGAQVPSMVRGEHAQVAIAIAELLLQTRQHLDLKSLLVYLLPGIAVCCGLLLLTAGQHRLVAGVAGGLCAVMAAVGFWKLLTTNTSTLFIAITIGRGLWLSLWAYVGLALAAALSVAALPRRPAPSGPLH